MYKPVQNITGPLFRDNPSSVNFLLVLFVVSYFIVGADLCKEMAKEKNEIGFITATLENSVHVDNTSILSLLEKVPPESGILPHVSFSIHTTDVGLFPPGRSPPSF
ncbi:MAG TPA: hypothetical protein VGK25_13710 [Ignavibacteria bacterium]